MAIWNFCFKLWWCFDNTEKGKSFDLLLERLSPTSTVVVQIDENSEPPPKKQVKDVLGVPSFLCLLRDSIALQERWSLLKDVTLLIAAYVY